MKHSKRIHALDSDYGVVVRTDDSCRSHGSLPNSIPFIFWRCPTDWISTWPTVSPASVCCGWCWNPSRADAILTESLDESFWTWLARTYPSPPGAAVPPGRSRFGLPQDPASQFQTSRDGLPGRSARQGRALVCLGVIPEVHHPTNSSTVPSASPTISKPRSGRNRHRPRRVTRDISRRPASLGNRRDWRRVETRSWPPPLLSALAGAWQQNLKRGAFVRGHSPR